MKEKVNMDQWLRKSMEDFRPETSDAARHRFLAELPVKGKGAVNGRLYGTLAVALLLSVTAIIWLASDRNNSSTQTLRTPDIKIINHAVKATKADNRIESPEGKNVEAGTKGKITEADIIETNTKPVNAIAVSTTPSTKHKTEKGYSKKTEETPESISVVEDRHETPVNFTDAVKETSDAANESSTQAGNNNTDGLSAGTPLTDNSKLITSGPENDKINNESYGGETSGIAVEDQINNVSSTDPGDQTSEKKEKKVKQGRKFANQTLVLYYRPEIVWNVIDNEKLIHNLGAEWNTRLFSGNYLLGTGIGVSLTRGYYEYAVEYNEFLGNYQQLDSITFDWNPREFVMQHTVHTSEETVFDTAVKTNSARVYRDFVYLQIPLTMGYDFLSKPNYSLGFRFVPVLSVLLSKKPVDFRYEAGNDRIIQINRITPDRVRTNWQLNAGINYSRRISETIRIELEPRFSYYFNSVYEKSDNSTSPLGASIRVAVGIKY